jgi:hypothetical protein
MLSSSCTVSSGMLDETSVGRSDRQATVRARSVFNHFWKASSAS